MSHQRTNPKRFNGGEPVYRVERHHDQFEVRVYEPYLVAEVTVPGPAEAASRTGFQLLAGYIFGGNHSAKRLPMTAPVTQTPVSLPMRVRVTQSAADDGYRVQFVMPPNYTLATLPVPNDARVTLRQIPAQRLAVRRYSGRWTNENYAQHLGKLRDALQAAGLAAHGTPILSRYNAPYVLPFLRRNEIWLPIE